MGIKDYLFDKEVKKAFSDFEVAPNPGVWSSIASHLSASQKPKPLIPLWIRIAAGIAILLGTSITAWLAFNDKNIPTADDSVLMTDSKELKSTTLTFEKGDFNATIGTDMTYPGIKPAATTHPIELSQITIEEKSNYRQTIGDKTFSRLDFLTSGVLVSEKAILPLRKLNLQNPPEPTMAEDLLADFPTPTETMSAFSVGIHFSPQFSFRSVDISFLSNTPFNDLEKPLLTYSAGAYARFKVAQGLSFQIGIEYSSLGQFIENIASVLHQPHFPSFEINQSTRAGHPQMLVTSFGHITFTTESLIFTDLRGQRIKSNFDFFANTNLRRMGKDDLGLSQKLTFLDVPVMLDLKLLSLGNTSFSIKGGGGFGYLIQNQVFLGKSAFSSSIGKTRGISKVSIFSSGSVKFDYKINNSFRFFIEPTFRKYMRAMFEESESFAPASPFKYSINTGVIIDF